MRKIKILFYCYSFATFLDFIFTYGNLATAEQERNPVARLLVYSFGKNGLLVSLFFEILTVIAICYVLHKYGFERTYTTFLLSLVIMHVIGFLSTLAIYVIPIPLLNITITVILLFAFIRDLDINREFK